MKGVLIMIGILLVVLTGLILWGITTYNGLIQSKEMVKNAMGQIATQVESRWDALSSLIDATKQYSKHESEVLENITRQRSGINPDSNPSEVEADSEIFQDVITRLNVVVENYPDLKASNIYENTMDKIDSYENNVRNSRMIFNDTVTRYNRSILVFPASIIAKMFNFHEEEYFKGTDGKSEMPSWN